MKIARYVSRLLTFVLIGVPSAPFLFGELQWEATSLERVVPVGVDTVEVAFPFSNPERYPVTIVALQPSCGCLTATLQKTTFLPGEKASLTAVFDGRNLVGPQEKTIQVISDDSPTPTNLRLRVIIPPWLQVSPRLLWWSVGEESKAKEVLVSVDRAAKAMITSVEAENGGVIASFRPTDDPARYRLIVQPSSTAAPLLTMVIIHLEAAGAAPRRFAVFVQVR